jgi:hypothetical protein
MPTPYTYTDYSTSPVTQRTFYPIIPGVRALLTYLGRFRDLADQDLLKAEVAAHAAEAPYRTPIKAVLSGCGDSLFLMWFGEISATCLAVYDRGFDSALAAASDWLRENEPGQFVDPDYADAEKALVEEWGRPVDLDSDEDREAICKQAETDLTYTESGWLTSWAWTAREAETADVLEHLYA